MKKTKVTDAYNLWVSHVAPLDNEKFPPAVSLESLCRDLSGGVACGGVKVSARRWRPFVF
jgi:hypothetical protein